MADITAEKQKDLDAKLVAAQDKSDKAAAELAKAQADTGSTPIPQIPIIICLGLGELVNVLIV